LFFLFSDIFIYAQQKGNRLLSIADYALTQLRIAVPDPDGACLSLYTPKKSFVLEFPGASERRSWQEGFDGAIRNAQENADASEIVEWQEAPIWVPDSATKVCQNCGEKFTTVKRRHHCRRCGNIYCSECLQNKIVLPAISDKPVMCCNDCYRRVQAK
jgi:hypothetical protein